MQVLLGKAICAVLLTEVPRATIVASIHKLIATLNQLVTYRETHPHLCAQVEKLDFAFQFQVIQALISDMEKRSSQQQEKGESKASDSSVGVALAGVHDVIVKIEVDLAAVERVLAEHNEKWFASWRAIDYSTHLSSLEQHKQLLETRFQLLREIVQCLH
jgi:hypothetical protein